MCLARLNPTLRSEKEKPKVSNGREFIETWFRRVWQEGDTAAIGEMFAGGTTKGLGAQTEMTAADFEAFHQAVNGILCDFDATVDRCVQEGDWVSALVTFSGRSKATGEKVGMTGSLMIRLENGVMHEAHNHWDFMGLWGQLGYLPPDSFEKGLAGETIV